MSFAGYCCWVGLGGGGPSSSLSGDLSLSLFGGASLYSDEDFFFFFFPFLLFLGSATYGAASLKLTAMARIASRYAANLACSVDFGVSATYGSCSTTSLVSIRVASGSFGFSTNLEALVRAFWRSRANLLNSFSFALFSGRY